MKSGRCICGNLIFFGNSQCLSCARRLGSCFVCGQVQSFEELTHGVLRCNQDACGAVVVPCVNSEFGVCSWMVPSRPGGPSECDWCRMTVVKPDSSNAEHRRLWAELERAKQRFLLQLKLLQLPPFSMHASWNAPLQFQFPRDEVDSRGGSVPSITGHQNGLVTIQLMEADSNFREKMRVELCQPHRSLMGHFRHEYGHYLDWATLPYRDQAETFRLFGDPGSIDYELAKSRHYSSAPPSNWICQFVSSYATMHPWEDFAETVSVYLDMISIWSNAKWFGFIQGSTRIGSMETLVEESLKISSFVSECNLDVGMPVLLPDRFSPQVLAKLACIHRLCFHDAAHDLWSDFQDAGNRSSIVS